ncbi:uncharacterized protein LOC129031560 [Pongo pygmaeus]|uniref:uncharacterized protein LOC129031560 n=1 Tax=Pongo pygmaeus TaxID=9600 RepID=UPI0023E23F5C|nr:uncharacterized protein LOC129031560 [Pongo pygmaeus]
MIRGNIGIVAKVQVCEGAGKARVILTGLERNTAIPSLNWSPSSLLAIPGCGKNPLPPRGPGSTRERRHAWLLPTREPSSPTGRAGAGKQERGAKGCGRPGKGGGKLGRLAGGFIVSFRPPPPAPRPQRHWKAARAARRQVIYSAGCARVTEPGPADGAADALGRGAESAGLRAGRRRQWASVCAAAAAAAAGGLGPGAGGRGPREGGGRLPGSLLCRPRPPKGNRPLSLPARTWALWAFSFSILSVSSPCPSLLFHFPRSLYPKNRPNMSREGHLPSRPAGGNHFVSPGERDPYQARPAGNAVTEGPGAPGRLRTSPPHFHLHLWRVRAVDAPALREEGLARILGTSWDAETGSEPSPFCCRELGKLAVERLARGRQAENLLHLLGNCNRFVMHFR